MNTWESSLTCDVNALNVKMQRTVVLRCFQFSDDSQIVLTVSNDSYHCYDFGVMIMMSIRLLDKYGCPTAGNWQLTVIILSGILQETCKQLSCSRELDGSNVKILSRRTAS